MNEPEDTALVSAAGKMDVAAMREALAEFLRAAGLPEAAEGEAPGKAAEAWAGQLLSGYGRDPVETLGETWPDDSSEMVTVTNIPFVSVCAHHLLPFYGLAHVAYLPGGRLAGLSRLTSLVDCLARRLQIQEQLSEQVCEALMEGAGARGAACLVLASHDCVGARKLEHRGVQVQTLAYRGEFADDPVLRNEFLQLVRVRERFEDE
ncbi:MAG: GTP cyclohydrolase I [Acidobacteria bacterium]|nr:GTP cyclohydrolase I [Acidobacteriota bacterium]